MPTTLNSILALDVGAKRVGVAVASMEARLPQPLVTLERGDAFFEALQKIINQENIGTIVVGLPRGLDGQTTAQTKATEDFAKQLRQKIGLPLHFQDEALTSKKAEAELKTRGSQHSRADIDALAATYILEDFLTEHKELVDNGVQQ